MNTVEFLRAVLPQHGIKVIATFPHPSKKKNGMPVFWHEPFDDFEKAAEYALSQRDSFDVYFWTHTTEAHLQVKGAFPKVRRSADKACWVRSFYVDLDVGDREDKYDTLEEAVADLIQFCRSTGLPKPLVVRSGRGLHVYWAFTQDVSSVEWKPEAEKLKRLVAHHGLKADPAVTAEAARVLRVTGTYNRKDPNNLLEVSLGTAGAPPQPFSKLVALIDQASVGLPSSCTRTSLGAVLERPAAKVVPETLENVEAMRAMLAVIDPDLPRPIWMRAVWGVAALGWSGGRQLARDWSATGKTFDEGEFAKLWDGFEPGRVNGISVGTLVRLATNSGYTGVALTGAGVAAPVAGPTELASAGGLSVGVGTISEADIANGERLALEARGRMLFVRETDAWQRFDPSAGWLSMPTDEVEGFAIAVVKTMRREACELHETAPFNPATKQALQNSKRASARPHMLAMIEMAKAVPGMAAWLADFDADTWLLGVRNGVLDLRTGRRRDFAPELRVSKRAAVAFDPAAVCPLWDAFLARVLPDREVRDFVRRWAGYCLTGDSNAQKWVFLFGSGANGKSVFTEMLAHVMGDYAHALATETLMDDPRSGRNNDPDIMALQGKRLAFFTETEENQRLAPARVKRLTGGDTLSGRVPYSKAPESFRPSHKIMGSGNHRPMIPDTSHGTWRRVALVEFGVEIPDHERDPDLAAKLRDEAAGILNWALEGLVDYRAGGLRLPAAVTASTDEYRHDEDVLGQFLSECCEMGESLKVSGAELYAAFAGWCGVNGRKHVPSKHLLTKQLKARRVTVSRDGGTYFGVRRLGVPTARLGSPDEGGDQYSPRRP